MEKIRPRIVVSQCLGFEACRYDGEMASEKLRDLLGSSVDWVPVCPEVEIGLGTPREPIRLVMEKGEAAQLHLVQPSSGRDLTLPMQQFAARYLKGLKGIDGFLFKAASPSCGVRDARYYSGVEKSPSLGRGPGLFAALAAEAFPHLAAEDEARLSNLRIREHYLTRIYASCRFRRLQDDPSLRALIDFHSRHKLLLMAYNQTRMREMGRLVAGIDKKSLAAGLETYQEQLGLALKRLPRLRSHTNVLQHAFGYFSRDLSAAERAHFQKLIERFHDGQTLLSNLIEVIQTWLVRFQVEYLLQQTYFNPFPPILLSLQNSGKGRI